MNGKIVKLKRARVNLIIECDIDHSHNIDVVFVEGDEAIVGRDILNKYNITLSPSDQEYGTLCSQTGFSCEGVCESDE